MEVEKKFHLTPEEEARLIEGAVHMYTKTICDVYFDRGVELCTTDRWLRLRDGRFELKLPMHAISEGKPSVDRYQEIDNDAEILEVLGLDLFELTDEQLIKAGFERISEYKTIRTSYEKEGFTIVFDKMDFEFQICEVERVVEEGTDLNMVADQILDFAKRHGLAENRVLGKLLVYLQQRDPDRFKAMQEAGVIPE